MAFAYVENCVSHMFDHCRFPLVITSIAVAMEWEWELSTRRPEWKACTLRTEIHS